MGVVKGVSFIEFPQQSDSLGRRVNVCFNYDTSQTIGGVIVRGDLTEPCRLIIKLDDGRYVLATECMYGFESPKRATGATHAAI